MARIYTAPRVAGRFFASLERGFCRSSASIPTASRTGRATGSTVLVFSVLFWVVLYAIQRVQGHLFLNPDHMQDVPSHLSLNTAASFITNTNWQFYGGEYTMSYLTQMAGLAVQNFVSAAVGIAVLVGRRPRARAPLVGHDRQLLGRPLPHARLPAAAARGRRRGASWSGRACRRRFHGHATATTLQGAQQTIARGPVASQIAIKQLGTNGGGFYNSNSAVPFENPTGLSNFIEMLAILLIPAAEVFMFGRMVLARRHAWAVFAAMFAVFAIGIAVNLPAEQHGSAVLRNSGVNIAHGQRRRAAGTWPTRRSASGRPPPRTGRSRRATPRTARSTAASTRMTPAGGAVPTGQPLPRRGDLRRGRLGPLRDVLLHRPRRLRGRADGRPHPGMAGEEDRGARDQVRGGRRALRPDDGPRPRRDLDRDQVRARLDLQPRRARLHRDALRLRLAGRTTTAARSPASA